jgi:hypothetical protein
MQESLFARLQSHEPALLTALATFVGGFLAQAGPGHISSLPALGTSVTISGLQGILTRGKVFSPGTVRTAAAVETVTKAKTPLVDPSAPVPWLLHGAEPSLTMAFVGLIAGFLVQVVGGSGSLVQALGVAAGLAGAQGVLTRQQVFSPKTVALAQLASESGLASLLSPSESGRLAGMLFKGPAVELAGLASKTPLAEIAGAVSGGPMVSAASAPAAASAPTAASAPAAAATTVAAVRVTATPGVTHPDPAVQPGLTSLLQRYRPEVRYDSLEAYYADSAAIITDRPGNLLKRQDGSVIAAAIPGADAPKLTLEFLGPRTYGNGDPVAATDYLAQVGTDFAAQARQMHLLAGYADRVHGRVVVDSSGARWLQYWFFMYYDDPVFLGLGTHQGDVEMIQLRLDAGGQPDVASYSQHRSGLRATWSQLELAATPDGPAPVTYSARGSHANLLRAGIQISTRSFLPDHNDGRGYRVRPELVVLSDSQTPWCLWPGSWGGSRAEGLLGEIGVTANSPAALNRHRAWNDPAGFHASCDLADDLPPAGQRTGAGLQTPPAPAISVEPSDNATVVHYSVPAGDGPKPTHIVVGLASPDSSAPAITTTESITGTSGTIELPPAPGPGPFAVHATTHDATGLASPTQSAAVPAK